MNQRNILEYLNKGRMRSEPWHGYAFWAGFISLFMIIVGIFGIAQHNIDMIFFGFFLGLIALGLCIYGLVTFRHQPQGAKQEIRGQDLEQALDVTFSEAYTGTMRTFNLKTVRYCPDCRGSGQALDSSRKICPTCRGFGRFPHEERLEVQIPPGVEMGTRIRLAGKGQPGRGTESPGDLYLVTIVSPDARFKRVESDLHTTVEIPQAIAEAGGKVDVPAPDRRSLPLTIPARTRDGQMLRLDEQGMPQLGTGERGHLYVSVKFI